MQRRVNDLEAFNPRTVSGIDDPAITALEAKLQDTIVEIFGPRTLDAARFGHTSLDAENLRFMPASYVPLPAVVASLEKGKAAGLSNLRTAIELLAEKLADGGDTLEGRAKRAFNDLALHPEIESACGQLFRDGHYANAVEDACKALDMLVKLRSKRDDPSGTELMQLVFSPKTPTLKFNEQTNESEKSEQQGMMFLFAGAMLALRNPRAHGLVNDHPERAVEYLSFISMLAHAVDRTKHA